MFLRFPHGLSSHSLRVPSHSGFSQGFSPQTVLGSLLGSVLSYFQGTLMI